jgi:hypothetical protein
MDLDLPNPDAYEFPLITHNIMGVLALLSLACLLPSASTHTSHRSTMGSKSKRTRAQTEEGEADDLRRLETSLEVSFLAGGALRELERRCCVTWLAWEAARIGKDSPIPAAYTLLLSAATTKQYSVAVRARAFAALRQYALSCASAGVRASISRRVHTDLLAAVGSLPSGE